LLRACGYELFLGRPPDHALYSHIEPSNPYDIERIHLATLTCRCGSAGPDQQHRSAGKPIALRSFTDTRRMKMAGQDHVDISLNKGRHGHLGSSDYVMRDFSAGHWIGGIERMVGYDNTSHILPALCQARHSGLDLQPVNATILERQCSRRIDPQSCNFCVCVEGCEIVRDETPIPTERRQPSLDDIVKRHVVITRHYELGTWQGPYESGGRLELRHACALSKITRNHDEIRGSFHDRASQGRRERRVDTAKVQI
jgi:hypothetical protein